MKKYKKGQRLTLVSKGIRKSSYTDRVWIDLTDKGRASFFEVSKVGTKYLYGYSYYLDGEEGLKKAYQETRFNPEEKIIHLGFNEDLKTRYNNYIQSLRAYDELRRKALYDIGCVISDIKRSKIEEWDTVNPRPTPLILRSERRNVNEVLPLPQKLLL